MRNYFLMVIFIICCFGCKYKISNQNKQGLNDELFAPALRGVLNEFFSKVDSVWGVDEDREDIDEDVYKDIDTSNYKEERGYNSDGKIYVVKFKKHRRLYRLSLRKEGRKNVVFLQTDYFYNKQKIKGYTFIGDRLVVYDGNYTGQRQNLIDTTRLIQFVDSIPGYDSDEVIDMDFEVIIQKHIIHTRDSLSLTYFGY